MVGKSGGKSTVRRLYVDGAIRIRTDFPVLHSPQELKNSLTFRAANQQNLMRAIREVIAHLSVVVLFVNESDYIG
jgi:hypothetical protein